MTGSAARHELARVARKGGWAVSRGARFMAGRSGRPGFAALHILPRWPVLDADGQQSVAMVALLINGRSALGRVIDGTQLRGYAGRVGAPVLERILMSADGGRDPLPSVEALPERAAVLLASADGAPALMRAETLLREMGAWPSI
ncbi:hypothetical protein U5A82_19510 [Sphingobium sp. CR2-8]|uniref:hypothetical protein n=1 Tax=Sphingobium sp. CR2-8 TaxID=1306534 RepID=UPI002DBE56B3|nr:hypothetical protein [Sphingobium sp. CR2-8]MEC3912581.1 hypothetical protein [Sphingobium sp. CR2-8]